MRINQSPTNYSIKIEGFNRTLGLESRERGIPDYSDNESLSPTRQGRRNI